MAASEIPVLRTPVQIRVASLRPVSIMVMRKPFKLLLDEARVQILVRDFVSAKCCLVARISLMLVRFRHRPSVREDVKHPISRGLGAIW